MSKNIRVACPEVLVVTANAGNNIKWVIQNFDKSHLVMIIFEDFFLCQLFSQPLSFLTGS
jgi:hypothetical protein